MEVSAKKLRDAERLVRQVRAIDRAIERMERNKPLSCRTLTYADGSNSGSDCPLEFELPRDIALGVIRTMRFHTLVKLSETGVTSMATGYRPVVSS